MALEPSFEAFTHGLFPLHNLQEDAILKLVEKKPLSVMATPDHALSLEQWIGLVQPLGLSDKQAAAVMRLTFALTADATAIPADHALRVPLGSLLVLLWVQWAHHELGESSATNVQRAQAASGEVWPSLLKPPAAAASAILIDGAQQQPSARTLAVQSRLSSQLVRRRRRLLQGSLPTLLQLAGAGAERLYAHELDRLALVMRPDQTGVDRLLSRGQPPTSLSSALGLWTTDKAKAAIPLHQLAPTLRAALVEVVARPAKFSPAAVAAANGGLPLRSPLAATQLGDTPSCAPAPIDIGDGALPPSTPITPAQPQPTPSKTPSSQQTVSASKPTPPPPLEKPTITCADAEDRDEREPSTGTLATSADGLAAPGYEVLRLQGAKRRTIVLRESDLRRGALQLIDCHGCYIYVLAPMCAAEMLGCTTCTIVLAAVAHVTSLSHCMGLKLYAASKAVRISNCHDTTCHLCVNSPPLVWGENPRLFLAPNPLSYATLADHMEDAKVHPQLAHNFWRTPVAFTGGSSAATSPVNRRDSGGATAAEACWALLPPAKFVPFYVPCEIMQVMCEEEADALAPPCELPGEYSAALIAHEQRLTRFAADIAALKCTADERKDVQEHLSKNFQEWLVRTGNVRQITDLLAKDVW